MIPNKWFKHDTDQGRETAKKIWRTMLGLDGAMWSMPFTAMLRNLGRMSSLNMFKSFDKEGDKAIEFVCGRLTDPLAVEKSRIHPVAVLNALRTYESGRGFRGGLSWDVNTEIVRALNKTFTMSFKNVKASGKNTMVALDVSGSMSVSLGLLPVLSAREASVAMALVTIKTEPRVIVTGFTSGQRGGYWGQRDEISQLPIHKDMTINEAVSVVSGLSFGGTDCALPMIYALKNKLDVDTFVVYTDSETYAGNMAPSQALAQYRKKMNKPDAKLIVVGMTATEFTIADPEDAGMLDVVGFDSAAPGLIADFSAGRLF
jgi:60 kDa SS-A/Ro ribonucleoprotein